MEENQPTEISKQITPDKLKTFLSTRKFLSVIVLILSALTIIQYKQLPESVPPKKYAYTIKYFADNAALSVEDEMNHLGFSGWQVVSARRATDKDNNYGYEFVLMKELPN
jgi:hypothetical protein